MIQWIKQLFANLSLRKLAISSVGLLTLMSIVGFATYEVTKSEVTVEADSEILSVFTHATTVGEVLEEQNIDVGVHDYIEPSVDTAIVEAMNIVYKQAQQIVVELEGEVEPVWTTASTVGDLMDELEVEVNEHDVIEPSLDSELDADTNITFESAFQVTVQSDGEEETVWTTSITVADLLNKENISLGELDRVEPSSTEIIQENKEINVIRVEKVTDVIEEPIDYATVTRQDSSLNRGTEDVRQQGQEGKIKKYYEVVFEDGEEVSRELVEEEVVQESEDRIVAVGTRNPTPTVSRGSGGWHTFTATKYTAFCPSGCRGITYTGVNVANTIWYKDYRIIAVDPSVIPLYSLVEVKTASETFVAKALDIGGAIKGNKIDILVPTRNEAMSFGIRDVDIRVIRRGK